MSNWNQLREGVSLEESSTVTFSDLEHVIVGPNCHISRCHIRGVPENPVKIEAGVTLLDCRIEGTSTTKSFSFGPWNVQGCPVVLGEGTHLSQSHIKDSWIGSNVLGRRCFVSYSHVSDGCEIRPHGNLILTFAAPNCNLGSEISKSILEGDGFVSEHTSSYLSLVAPSRYPLLTEDGKEVLSPALPNLTNIGAGTVFANYSGKPKPAEDLLKSSGSLKGTAVVLGAFTAVNSVIVNRYEQPAVEEDLFSMMRQRDVTILGLGCLVERKVTGRIPAFSHAFDTSAKSIAIGDVLEKQPGIVLNILKKMRKRLGSNGGALQGLINGTLRLEIKLLKEQLAAPRSFFLPQQLQEGIARLESQLDGRWSLDHNGELKTPWRFDDTKQRWFPDL